MILTSKFVSDFHIERCSISMIIDGHNVVVHPEHSANIISLTNSTIADIRIANDIVV